MQTNVGGLLQSIMFVFHQFQSVRVDLGGWRFVLFSFPRPLVRVVVVVQALVATFAQVEGVLVAARLAIVPFTVDLLFTIVALLVDQLLVGVVQMVQHLEREVEVGEMVIRSSTSVKYLGLTIIVECLARRNWSNW